LPIPYDHSFKLLADDDPRAALAVFAGIPLDADIEVETTDRELNVETLRVDNLYRCRQNGEEFLVHFEAVSRFRADTLDRQAGYVRAIVTKYKLPCRSYILLLTETGVPARLPKFLDCSFGDYASRIRLRAVRLWRIPARRVLRMGRLALLPWVALMKVTPDELRRAQEGLIAARRPGLAVQFAVLGGLRYGTKELFEERLAAMTTEEIIEDSYFYTWVLEKGEKKGLEQGREQGLERGLETGREQGKQIGLAEGLISLLTARFGALSGRTADRIRSSDVETLSRWITQCATGASLDECLR